jgi:acyl-ACP thioesterase
MDIPFTNKYTVRSYESDLNNKVKISSIFDYMQESASLNAELLKFGYEDMQREGLFWVLSRAKVIIHEYVSAWDEIIIETWPKNINSFFANRDFRFYNSEKVCIGAATTAWLMVNRETLRPVKPENLLKDIHKYDIPPGIVEFPEKIPELKTKTFSAEFNIGYKDIDINQHTNNARYIDYLQDCCLHKFSQNKQIESLQINFLNQTRIGDTIRLFVNEDEKYPEKTYIEAENQDNVKVFNSILNWK